MMMSKNEYRSESTDGLQCADSIESPCLEDEVSQGESLVKLQAKVLDKLAGYLATRDHSEKELREKLSRKFNTNLVDWALQEAHRQNWISPPEELSERVALMLHQKRKGINYIQKYLANKGLPLVKRQLELELRKCRSLLNNKFHEFEDFSFEDRAKAYKYLQYRGFDDETIKKAIYESQRD